MTNLNSHYSDTEWIEQVYQLLSEIARTSLSDKPKLPDNLADKALPLVHKAKIIQEKTDGQIIPSDSLEWVEKVRQLLLDLSRASLADIPRLPVSMGQRSLSLAETAKEIK
ncbi:MAG: inorganic pyrophosphatase, partial [Okeania sp. SIO3C4]|nr:inorganic pyrophosphatase [Okeania sp. SIO3C4]